MIETIKVSGEHSIHSNAEMEKHLMKGLFTKVGAWFREMRRVVHPSPGVARAGHHDGFLA